MFWSVEIKTKTLKKTRETKAKKMGYEITDSKKHSKIGETIL